MSDYDVVITLRTQPAPGSKPLRPKVGQMVEWWSQSRGTESCKRGKVVYRVRKGVCPFISILTWLAEKHDAVLRTDGFSVRDHVSWLVLVPHPGKGKPRIYWPRVSSLMEAE